VPAKYHHRPLPGSQNKMEFPLQEWIRSTVEKEAEKLLALRPKNSADTLTVHLTDKKFIQIINVGSKFGGPNSY
jgi:hypothetical protein